MINQTVVENQTLFLPRFNFTAASGAFIGVTSPKTWIEAQTYCRQFYTDLASALSQVDNDQLAQVASAQGPSWFGLYRDTWKWLNNTKATNILWGPGEPDINKTQDNCGALKDTMIVNENCNNPHYFFCDYRK